MADFTQLNLEDHPTPYGGVIRQLNFQRPEALNAISRQLLIELEAAIADIERNRTVRVLLLTGSGRAFSTGADLKERAGMSDNEVREFLRRTGQLFQTIETLYCPVIAAINGYAFGGGLELALCCDLRYMAQSAQVGLTETSLGIIPGAGGTQRLWRAIGIPRAKELILTARRIDAETAARMDLVHEVCPDDALMDRARTVALEIARNAPIALEQARFAIHQGGQVDLQSGLAIERKAYEVTIPTLDRREALEAFREKRDPQFQGK